MRVLVVLIMSSTYDDLADCLIIKVDVQYLSLDTVV